MYTKEEAYKKIDCAIFRIEYYDFIKSMINLKDINYFIEVLETKDNQEKETIEEGLIYLSTLKKEELKEYEKIFLEKYHKYLISILEKDVKNYLNNKYCNYLFCNDYLVQNDKQSQDMRFINGKSFAEIETLILDEYDKLIENTKNKKTISEEDKKFIEEMFLVYAFYNIIYKEYDEEKDLMYDIVEFFKLYPIEDISNSRNRQLNLLSVLSSIMIQNSFNCGIIFSQNYGKKNNKIGLGSYSKTMEEIPIIEIKGLELILSEEDYLRKMFTIFHELAHLYQCNDLDEYINISDYEEQQKNELKKIIEIESFLVENSYEFYNENHDNFFVEKDADYYATKQLIKIYGKQYPKQVNTIIVEIQNKKTMDDELFLEMELEEYNKLFLLKNKKSLL